MTLKRIAPVLSLIALLGLTIGGAQAQTESTLIVGPGAPSRRLTRRSLPQWTGTSSKCEAVSTTLRC